ncbi:MAG TPA: rhodanese-like domain-containing protein [Rhodobacteraceae bacterium]|nr:rhodanese-like domain-containing protein [Paracoccaceae bacterium]
MPSRPSCSAAFARILPLVAAALALLPGAGAADPVNIARDRPSVTVETPQGPAEIRRNQDTAAMLDFDWALTSRPCPPYCIQPMVPAKGVTPVGELELLDMLRDPQAVVIDSRTSDWYAGGTIPGSVNIPWNVTAERLDELGCEADFDGWYCGAEVPRVALFCNGPWCGQSPTAIRRMIDAGYPADKIAYYRGGMQVWRLLGLTVTGEDG